jgi:hypothetical protein
MLNHLNEMYWTYYGWVDNPVDYTAKEQDAFEVHTNAVIRSLLAHPSAVGCLRAPVALQLALPTMRLHKYTVFFWYRLKKSYDNTRNATFAALLCLRLRLRLPRDVVQLICKDWVWPGRFEAWKRVA